MFRKKKKVVEAPSVIVKRVVRMTKEVSLVQSPLAYGERNLNDSTVWHVGVYDIYDDGKEYQDGYHYNGVKTLEEAEKCFQFLLDNEGNYSIKTIIKEADLQLKK
jgi:hypothetical protein